MFLYTIGCSFTQASGKGWPDILAKKLQQRGLDLNYDNAGFPGAGNAYIAEKLVTDIQYKKPDLAIIMWSGLTRKDLIIDHSDVTVLNAFGDYKFIRRVGKNTSYVLSGGIKGSWEEHPMTKEVFGPLYKISTDRSMAYDTLVNMISLQNYLKQNEIPYIMSSYMNYWGEDELVGQLDYGLLNFEDLRCLYDQIDFSKWVFANTNKDCIYELAKTVPNGLMQDKVHPDFHVHEMWVDKLLEKIDKDGLIK